MRRRAAITPLPPSAKQAALAARHAARRDAIVAVAEELFIAHGFHGVSFAELAKAAGLGNAGLVHHFASKAKLYRAVLERLAAELDEYMRGALAEYAPVDTRGRLTALVRVVATWSFQRAGRARLMMRELLDNVDRVERARALPLASFVASCTELVETARAEQLVRTPDSLALLARIFGTIGYAQIVRPTFAKISGWRVVADERRWRDAIVEDLEGSLFHR